MVSAAALFFQALLAVGAFAIPTNSEGSNGGLSRSQLVSSRVSTKTGNTSQVFYNSGWGGAVTSFTNVCYVLLLRMSRYSLDSSFRQPGILSQHLSMSRLRQRQRALRRVLLLSTGITL